MAAYILRRLLGAVPLLLGVATIIFFVLNLAPGYPTAPQTGQVITGIDEAEAVDGVTVFHAGTRRDGQQLVTAGGRVLDVVAMAPTFDAARERAYRGVDRIHWDGVFCRRDIGGRAG